MSQTLPARWSGLRRLAWFLAACAQLPFTPSLGQTVPSEDGAEIHAALELSGASVPSGRRGGANDGFLAVLPLVGAFHEDAFALEVGARLRLRVLDASPGQRSADLGGILRREDWDERTDLGQLLRALKVGSEGGSLSLEGGPVELYSLGRGYLLHRYRSRTSEDTHPSTLALQGTSPALHLELFASDFLAARIFAGELLLDLGTALGSSPALERRLYVGLQAAHEAGRGRLRTDEVTLLHADLDAVLYRGADFRLAATLGGGMRAGAEGALGAVAGLSAEGSPAGARAGGKLELRRSGGGFRYAYFGPGYELSRLSGVGHSEPPQSQERLPAGLSLATELALELGAPLDGDEGGGAWLSLGAERFFWGRTDLDLALALQPWPGVVSQARLTVVGLGVRSRLAADAELRYRLGPAVYLLAYGGTSFSPQLDGTLLRGVSAGAGVGLDLGR